MHFFKERLLEKSRGKGKERMESRKRGQKKMIECMGETAKFKESAVEIEKKERTRELCGE